MTAFKSLRLLASTAAVALCAAGTFAPFTHVAEASAATAPAAAAPATPPQRQLGPPPGAGEGLEDGAPPPPPPAQEKPLVPVTPPNARSATQVDTQPTPEEGTRLLLGEIEILDIPLAEIPNYRDSMREIVSDLSIYAHGRDPKFILATRGGFDLLTWSRREFDLDEIKRDPLAKVLPDTIFPIGMPIRTYVQQLNGIILNGQYCAPLRVPRDDLAAMQKRGLKILSIDHCKTTQDAATALQAAIKSNVVAHTDADVAGTFGAIPKAKPSPENPRNVEVLGDARNMLVMFDSAAYPSREEWLAALQKTNYDVLITDAFYKGNQPLTKDEVHGLKFKEICARRLVMARLNVGYAEDERYYWKREWRIGEPSWIQSFGPDGPGEYVVEYWNPAWKAIVGKYFQGIMDLG